MSNLLKAILNITSHPEITLQRTYLGRNSINNVGNALELYIQDAFANTFLEDNQHRRDQIISATFSYLGNSNNPPDLILKNSDAIEVKKIQNIGSVIALNSSYPKHKLYSTDPKITKACRLCESTTWQEKDIIYAIGLTSDIRIRHLWFVYGDCYAANQEIYHRIGEKIKNGVLEIPNIEFSITTKELGRVNKVDPLGITNLRIRGMWHIENPSKVFRDIYTFDNTNDFSVVSLMRKDKFESFSDEDRNAIINHPKIISNDVQIKNPDNPAQLLDTKLIYINFKEKK